MFKFFITFSKINFCFAKKISPVYFTVCGKKKDEACIITRNPGEELNRLEIAGKDFLIQTNMDHWSDNPEESILDSLGRRRIFKKAFENTDKFIDVQFNEETMWELYSSLKSFFRKTFHLISLIFLVFNLQEDLFATN